MDQKDTEMNEKGVSSSTSGVVVQVREKKGALRAAIPYMPFPVAVICLFLNTFVPGLGEYEQICLFHHNHLREITHCVFCIYTRNKLSIPSTSSFNVHLKSFKFAFHVTYIYTQIQPTTQGILNCLYFKTIVIGMSKYFEHRLFVSNSSMYSLMFFFFF